MYGELSVYTHQFPQCVVDSDPLLFGFCPVHDADELEDGGGGGQHPAGRRVEGHTTEEAREVFFNEEETTGKIYINVQKKCFETEN